MFDQTLRSLFHLIDSRRASREAFARTIEQAPLPERPRWNVQIAVFDEQYRAELAAVDEVQALLACAPRLRDSWPYPSDYALQEARAELANRMRKSVTEIDDMPLGELVAILGTDSQQNGPVARSPIRKEITAADMATLPQWATVAFAARCARRVQRLLTELAPTAPTSELNDIEHAIALAEQAAADARRIGDKSTAEALEAQWATFQAVASRTPAIGPPAKGLAELLRFAVGKAAACAARSAVDISADRAYQAYGYARQAAFAVQSQTVLDLMARDFDYLATMAVKKAWTDQTAVAATTLPQPQLRLAGLHIRDLRCIRQFDLPQDGLGWQGVVPDLILLAGINGSGKTTLLNFLTDAVALITRPAGQSYDAVMPKWLDAREAWVDFELESYEVPRNTLRFIVGDADFVDAHKTGNCWWIVRSPDNRGGLHDRKGNPVHDLRKIIDRWFGQVTIPSVVFVSSEERTLIVPGDGYKAAGKPLDDHTFVHRWQLPAPGEESLPDLLYSLRWEDLNAGAEAPFTQLSRFSAYADAFRRLAVDSKYLKFEDAKLVVKIPGSNVAHDLSELSSGEKQVLVLCGELLRYWRPGSLILIDEPELHLHSRWQTRLYEALRYWQTERGGQVILATQSSHLFEIAESGAAVLLGVDSL